MNRFLLGVSSLLLSACAPTAHERFGDVARYAPSYASYVVGGEDDVVILRDPVTSQKIRCREDLLLRAPALADTLEDEARDRHARAVAPVALGPLTVAGYAAGAVALGLWLPVSAIDELFVSTQPRQLYEKARAAFQAQSFAEARELFLALVTNNGHGDAQIDDLPRAWVELSLYYLALSAEALHNDEEAREAFRRFVTMSSVKDEERYRDAEARLARLDDKAGSECASRADFTFAWGRSR